MATLAPGAVNLETERVVRKVIRRLIPFLVVLFAFNLLDRVNIGFAALTMNKALGLTAAMFGFAGSLYWIGSLLIEVPGNIILSKVGARRTLAVVMLSWGIVATGMAFVHTPTTLYILRLLLGIAEGTCWPGILLFLTYWIPETHRAGVNSKFMICLPLTNMLASPISALISTNMNGVLGYEGWKWLFMLEGCPPIILGIIGFLYLTDRPNDAKWLTDNERRLLQDAIERGHKVQTKKHEGILTAFKNPLCYVFGFGWMGIAFFMSAITTFFPLIVRHLGVRSAGRIGIISAVPFLAGLIAMLWWGKHSDKKKERLWHAVSAALVGGLGWVLAALFQSGPLQIAAITLATMGLYGVQCTFWALPPAAFSKKMVAVGVAIVAAEGQLGGFFAPIIFGKLRDATGNYKLAFLSVTCAMIVTALACIVGTLWSRARQKREAALVAAAGTAQ